MENDERQPQPRDIDVFIPDSVELIDPRQPSRAPVVVDDKHVIIGPRRLPVMLYIATCLSTVFVAMHPGKGTGAIEFIVNGLYYAVPLMLILTFHELGHFLQARRYRIPASLPFFIPMPLSPFGTMGAVILQGSGVANRKQMFDIAISGPLAGLVLAIPFTYYGLTTSELRDTSTLMKNDVGLIFGEPLVFQWIARIVFPEMRSDQTIMTSPMAFAGWVGIFITALNLIPIGQFDGGHILYMLIRRKAHVVAMLILGAAVVWMAITKNFSYGLIVILLMVFGPRHPPTSDDSVPLGWPRIILGWLTLAFIIIGFTPTPIVTMQQEVKEKQQAPEKPQKQQIDSNLFAESSGGPPRRTALPSSVFVIQPNEAIRRNLPVDVALHELERLRGEMFL